MVAVSCDDLLNNGGGGDLGTPNISIDQKELTFEIAGGDKTIELTSSRDWTVEIPDGDKIDWISVTPDEGKASAEAQKVTISVANNGGYDREMKIKFLCGGGMASATLTVTQAGTSGSATAHIVYYNDFDKEKASKVNDSWKTYLDDFDGWKNATGTGAENCGFASNGVSARTNSADGSAGKHSVYEGSGMNYLWFGKENFFAITDIALNPEKSTYTLSFGTERYEYSESGDIDNTFRPDEFKVYVSDATKKWVEVKYAFPGELQNGKWDLASTTFTLPAGTSVLNLYFTSTTASVNALDDVKLVVADGAEGTAVDFANGVDLNMESGSSGDGGSSAPATEYTIPELTDLKNDTKVIVKGYVVAHYAQGFMMSDGTNNILVFEKDKPSNKAIGTNVTVTASKATFSGQAQLSSVVSVEDDGTTTEVTYPTPMEVTAANIASLAEIAVPTYVTYTGKLVKSGSYYNVEIEGSETLAGGVTYPDADMIAKITPWVTGTVKITGYYIGMTNKGLVASTMVTAIELVGEAPENPGTPDEPEVPAEPLPTITATMIDKVEDLVAGTYYMGTYATKGASNNPVDFTANPYHLSTGNVSSGNGDCYTTPYSYAEGVLTAKEGETVGAVEIVLEAVEGKADTYYIKFPAGYLYSKEAASRSLAVGETPQEWVASAHTSGGIMMTGGGVNLGAGQANSNLIRAYTGTSNVKHGLLFFKAAADDTTATE